MVRELYLVEGPFTTSSIKATLNKIRKELRPYYNKDIETKTVCFIKITVPTKMYKKWLFVI